MVQFTTALAPLSNGWQGRSPCGMGGRTAVSTTSRHVHLGLIMKGSMFGELRLLSVSMEQGMKGPGRRALAMMLTEQQTRAGRLCPPPLKAADRLATLKTVSSAAWIWTCVFCYLVPNHFLFQIAKLTEASQTPEVSYVVVDQLTVGTDGRLSGAP